MYAWIVLLSLLVPATPTPADTDGASESGPLRYRGIERLLAKFDAEQPGAER